MSPVLGDASGLLGKPKFGISGLYEKKYSGLGSALPELLIEVGIDLRSFLLHSTSFFF